MNLFRLLIPLFVSFIFAEDHGQKYPRRRAEYYNDFESEEEILAYSPQRIPEYCIIGPPGQKGAKGIQGFPGKIGIPGPAGVTGPSGLAGPLAPNPVGPQGDPGPDGPVGVIGPAGPQGEDGDPGLTGPVGFSGATGPNGPVGDQGPRGPPGTSVPQGVSEYLYIYNEGPQVIPSETIVNSTTVFGAVKFSSNVALGGGLQHATGTSEIYVANSGFYKIQYVVSSSKNAQLGVRIGGQFGTVDLSTVWSSGVANQQVTGIGVIYVPGGSVVELVNYFSGNDLPLNGYVNAAFVIEKLGV